MAHECPTCGCTCHCGGDIDDICFGEAEGFCSCCDSDDDDWDDDENEDFYNSNPFNRLNTGGFD